MVFIKRCASARNLQHLRGNPTVSQAIFRILTSAVLGAIIGAAALFFLSEGRPEGAFAGAIVGAGASLFTSTRMIAHRSAAAGRKSPRATLISRHGEAPKRPRSQSDQADDLTHGLIFSSFQDDSPLDEDSFGDIPD